MSLFGSSSFSGFGTPASAPPPAAASTSLFGAPAAAPTSAAPSLFGAPAASAAPSLFGSPVPAVGAGGLFGAAPKPATTFGGFGAPAPPAAGAGGGGGGLFGSPAPALGASGGLFGQPAPAAGAAGGGMFGSSAGKSLFGAPAAPAQPQPQPQPPAPGGASDQFTKATKFNDLPDGARAAIEGIEASIRSQIAISDDLKSRDLGRETTLTTTLYSTYSSEATAVSNMLSQDSRLAQELKEQLERDQLDLSKGGLIVEGFKNPQQKGAQAKSVAGFPFEYFSRKADEFRHRLAMYKSTMDQIQSLLSHHSSSPSPSSIPPTLRAQHTSFMALASEVAALDLQLKGLKDEYRAIWRDKTGMRGVDPFRRARGEGGGVGVERGVRGLEIR